MLINRFQFEGCGRAFARMESRKIHLRSHTRELGLFAEFIVLFAVTDPRDLTRKCSERGKRLG